MHTLTLPAKIEHLAQWLEFVTVYARDYGMPAKRLQSLELALEEALVNICRYAYAEGAGEVTVTCTVDTSQRFTVEIMDHGRPFDPLSLAAPDMMGDLANRPVGGLGVFLIRKLMDEVIYQRAGDQNLLRLIVQPQQES